MDKSEIDIINDCCGRFRKNSQLAINTYNNDMKQYCVLRFIIDFLPDKKLFTTTDIQIRVENSNDDWVREHNWTSGVSGHMKIVYEFMSKIGMMVKSPGERAAFNYNFTDLYNKYRLNGVEWVYIWEALKKYWREQKLEAKQKKDIPEVVKDIRELIDRLDDLDKQVINLDDQINANDLRLTELENLKTIEMTEDEHKCFVYDMMKNKIFSGSRFGRYISAHEIEKKENRLPTSLYTIHNGVTRIMKGTSLFQNSSATAGLETMCDDYIKIAA